MKEKSKNIRKYPVGTKLGYLTILSLLPKWRAECRCVCGSVKTYYIGNLIAKPGKRVTVSCGCKRIMLVKEKNASHGLSGSSFYRRWVSMKNRVLPSYIDASAYIGVSVCDRWQLFDNFLEDMYEPFLEHVDKFGESHTTLDRINVLGNYEPTNCRWATPKVQSLNKKNTLYIEYEGASKPLMDVCTELGLSYGSVRARLRRGYGSVQALTFSPWEGNRKKHPNINT